LVQVVDAMLDGMEGSDLPDVMLPTVIPSQSASAAHLQAFEDPMLALNSGVRRDELIPLLLYVSLDIWTSDICSC
jgi:hypothetical protein